jgi:hypothetical protein
MAHHDRTHAMLHLSAERLAALADDEPTTTEGEHLARCAPCAQERAAQRSLRSLAASDRFAGNDAPLLTSWDALLPALRAEGLVADAIGGRAAPNDSGPKVLFFQRRWAHAGLMRAAAALLLVAVGLAAGRWSAGASPVPGLATGRDTLTSLVTDTTIAFQNASQALAALTRYEHGYQAAAQFLALHDTASRIEGREAYQARLATLDQVAAATRQGLQETPYDPVINRYYLSALSARQATLQQLSSSLPPNVQVGGY